MTPTNGNSDGTQCVWLVRYGLTEYPLVEDTGPYDSDIDPKEGIEHAQAIAKRIAESGTTSKAPTIVYASPFLRTVHTAHIIAKALINQPTDANKKVVVNLEEGLTEWQVKSLLVVKSTGERTFPKPAVVHAKTFDTIDTTYHHLNPLTDKADDVGNYDNQHDLIEETEDALLQRCGKTIDAILKHANGQNVVIVAHAPCDIAIALHLNGKQTLQQAKGQYEPWPLGGLTLFSRESNNDDAWKMEMYGDCSHMPGDYEQGLKRWTLPSL